MRRLPLWCLFLCLTVWGQAGFAAEPPQPLAQASELKNRFRIDHMVDEITLMVQREYGSAPVVVVLPDGSKWYASRHPQWVHWEAGISGDMIRIAHPQPGPWQLLGQIVPGSQITKVSRLGIWIDPLPQPLYQSERLKLNAGLTGDELHMRLPGLAYMLKWNAKFISARQAEDENFAAGSFTVGSFQDDGEQLDERPDDGLFTADINLNHPWGHYTLDIQVANEVFEREYQQDFVLSPIPADIEVTTPEDPQQQPWGLQLVVDTDELQLSETHFQLEIIGPAGFHLSLTVRELAQATHQLALPQVTEFGSYRIKGTLYSTNWAGREIVLTLPERFFNYVAPPEPPPSPEVIAAMRAEEARMQEQQAKEQALWWLIVGNGVLLVSAIALILFLRKRAMLKQALAAAERELLAQQAKDAAPLDLQDIDLSLPDDDEKPH
ncbi:TIGR03503 family protein [Shewanella sp. YIC-542]|uniref:TIGR03503 family protein n=1 Tax=Shewanella mytili TaxID=3377111 RepID=UPI00398F0EB7